MPLLASDGRVEKGVLTKVLEQMNLTLRRVIVPSGRLPVSLKVDNIPDMVEHVSLNRDADLDLQGADAKKDQSIFDLNSVVIEFPEVEYRLDSIPGGWEEFLGQAFNIVHQEHVPLPDLHCFVKLRAQIANEVDKILGRLPILKDNKVVSSTDVESAVPEGMYGQPAMTIKLRVYVTLAQF